MILPSPFILDIASRTNALYFKFMSHEEVVYAEGSKLDAVIAITAAVIAVSVIATIVLLTNNGNTPPAWTGV